MSKNAKRWLIAALCGAGAFAVLLFVTARVFAGKIRPEVHKRVVSYLEQRFDSKVALGDLQIEIPKVSAVGLLWHRGRGTVAHVEGRGLSLRHRNSQEGPPLLTIDAFSFDLDVGMLRQAQPTVPYVAIVGMTIALPPKSEKLEPPPPPQKKTKGGTNVVIGSIDISHARLLVLPRRADAKPLDFALESIHLTSAGIGQRMKYQASLTNPRPPGQIKSQGTFGPWDSQTPGDTFLEGIYDFSNADLSVFPAIAGILHSTGRFSGTLSAVRAKGQATVPDFRLKTSGNRVPLETEYDVIVDGTNGNTILQPVHARLKNTWFETSGSIIKHDKGVRRAIDLEVNMPRGRIEDLLLLAAKGKPFMSGAIRMNAKISVPPLSGTIKEKLFLSGAFTIEQGEFLKDEVQDKVDELSRRGQGRPDDRSVDNVFSSMTGKFRLENQTMTFSRLSFEVPGASVGLHGDYRMVQDTLDFHGDLKLQAKVSQTLSGWKHWLAKPIDHFFEKDGAGTFLRIQVVGNANKPEFGRDHAPAQ